MKVQIKPTNSNISEITATLIRGNDPDIWLREISSWKISLNKIVCYIIPQSNTSLNAYGLFVIFQEKSLVKNLNFLEPYIGIADKLFIPDNMILTPAMTNDEVNNFLIWDIQVFHPLIGLIGFKKEDRLDLSDLITLPDESINNWGIAHPGILAKPKLTKVDVLQPTAEQIMELITKVIENKPLEDIKKLDKEEDKKKEKPLNNFKHKILKQTLKVTEKILDFGDNISENANYKPQQSNNTPKGPGLLERFENWLRSNLAEVEEKRNDEIKRLLNLFDENSDEALKFAIALDSPYLSRGQGSQASSLSKHSTNLNLNQLGGGGKSDYWNVDNYYYDLRSKYINVAAKEINTKNFKKAAYIYANLLGDFNGAANILEQGKFYREASVLYKEHLKNLPAAASCLENGGLILEAIEIYEKLNRYEKVADLYRKINMNEQSNLYYERFIKILLDNSDYLKAAEIVSEKMEQKEVAKEILLQGWNNSNQSETCLKRYFELLEETDLNTKVQEIYSQISTSEKHDTFLNIMIDLNKKNKQQELLKISKNIAYEIIGKQAERGNISNLYKLKIFMPDDKLISSDCRRFSINNKKIPKKLKEFKLDNSVVWSKIICHHNQFIVFGKKGYDIHLARGNWYGNFEYHSWTATTQYNYLSHIIANPLFNDHIFIHTSDIPLDTKILPKNNYFDKEITIDSIDKFIHTVTKTGSFNTDLLNNLQEFSSRRMMKNSETAIEKNNKVLGIAIDHKSELSVLKEINQGLTMQQYSYDGVLKGTIDCEINDENFLMIETEPAVTFSEMIYIDGMYYTFKGRLLLVISDDYCVIDLFILEEKVVDFVWFYDYYEFKIAIRTENNFFLFEPADDEIGINKFFRKNIEYVDMKFISAKYLIIAEKFQAYIHDFSKDRHKIIFISGVPIIGILQTNNRNQCAFLDKNGTITICDIRDN